MPKFHCTDYCTNTQKIIFHLIQVNTAKDWCDEVVKFVRGHAEMSEYNFLRQDNTTQQNVESGGIVKVESPKPEIKTEFEKLIKKEKNENMFDQEIIEKMTENLMDNIDNNLTKDIKQLEIKDEPDGVSAVAWVFCIKGPFFTLYMNF